MFKTTMASRVSCRTHYKFCRLYRLVKFVISSYTFSFDTTHNVLTVWLFCIVLWLIVSACVIFILHQKIQDGEMYLLVPAHPGCPDKVQRAVKWLCVCVCCFANNVCLNWAPFCVTVFNYSCVNVSSSRQDHIIPKHG